MSHCLEAQYMAPGSQFKLAQRHRLARLECGELAVGIIEAGRLRDDVPPGCVRVMAGQTVHPGANFLLEAGDAALLDGRTDGQGVPTSTARARRRKNVFHTSSVWARFPIAFVPVRTITMCHSGMTKQKLALRPWA